MKKIAIMILAVMLIFSLVTITACGGETEAKTSTQSSKSVSESKEESKAPRKSGNAVSVVTSQPQLSYASGGVIPTPQASGNAVTVVIASADVTTDLGKAIAAINMIGTVSSGNYESKEQLITNAETKCRAFSSSQIPNYNSLLAARAAYNSFVESVSLAVIAQFKEKIALVSDFVVDATYSTDVAAAQTIYNSINKDYLSRVSSEAATLKAAVFHDKLNKLPTVENLTGAYYKDIKTLTADFTSITQASYTPYADSQSKLNAYNTKLKSVWVERTFIANDTDNNGIVSALEITKNKTTEAKTDRNNFFTMANSGCSSADTLTYSDSLNTNVTISRIFKGTVDFNAPCGGVLKFYVEGQGRNYTVKFNGNAILTTEDVADNGIGTFEVDIPSSGAVHINASYSDGRDQSGQERIYAVSFGYPAI